MARLSAHAVCVRVPGATLLDDVSLDVGTQELVALLGPNGAGKTTLLRTLLGLQAAESGYVELDGQRGDALSPRQRAKRVSYLPQQRLLAWPIRVRDVVALGRFAHGASIGRLSELDESAVERALTACDLLQLADRRSDTLSGGEQARMHFARALCADAPLLIADEPVAALDPSHEIAVAELLRQFVDSGGSALVVLHDVERAANIADRLIWMRDGRIVADGSPEVTLTGDIIRQVYGVDARLSADEHGFSVRFTSSA
ncbi:MAG: ABC transporter ATP-binding protein [Pseudomonadota bacterium]